MVVDLIHEALSIELHTVARAERHRCSSWCEGAKSNEEDGGGFRGCGSHRPSLLYTIFPCRRLLFMQPSAWCSVPPRRQLLHAKSPCAARSIGGEGPLVAQVAKSPISASRVLLWPRVSRAAGEGRAQRTTRGPISLCQIIRPAHCAAREGQ